MSINSINSIKLAKALEIFVTKAQSMTSSQAFDLNDIFDALRVVGIVDQSSTGFADQYMTDIYRQDPSRVSNPDWQLFVTLYPSGDVDVQIGSQLSMPNLRNNFGMNAKKAWRLLNESNIKNAVKNHFKNNGLALPMQPTTAIVPS